MRQAIINLINKWACMHKWESHKVTDWTSTTFNDNQIVRSQETLICEKCGKIKKISL